LPAARVDSDHFVLLALHPASAIALEFWLPDQAQPDLRGRGHRDHPAGRLHRAGDARNSRPAWGAVSAAAERDFGNAAELIIGALALQKGLPGS
jgi:hypothetical protein